MTVDLVTVWAVLIAFSVLAYVMLDGFDLGIGILFAVFPGGEDRDVMINSIAPLWDGNETWLVFGGAGLFAVFPLAFAILLPAFYAPLIAMLLALIFRGVAIEFRERSDRHRRLWDFGFCFGSATAAFCQGLMLGAFIGGVEVEGRAYAGGWFDWLSPFTVMTGLAVATGYALLGATWLVLKTEGPLQDACRRRAAWLFLAVLGFLGLVSLWTPLIHPAVAERWFAWPNLLYLSPVPLLVLAAAAVFLLGLRRQSDLIPFSASQALFVLSFAGLGISLWPDAVPGSVTLRAAAAPDESLRFMLWGAAVLLPVILAYTGHAYWVFRGKVGADEGYH